MNFCCRYRHSDKNQFILIIATFRYRGQLCALQFTYSLGCLG